MFNLLAIDAGGGGTPPIHTTSDTPPDYGLFITGIFFGLLAGIFINLIIKTIKNYKKDQRERDEWKKEYDRNVTNIYKNNGDNQND